MTFTQQLNDDLEQLFKSKHRSIKANKQIGNSRGNFSINTSFGGSRSLSQTEHTQNNIRILNSIAYKESEVYIGVKGKQVSASHTLANFIYVSRIDRDEEQHVKLETSDGDILKSIDKMNQEAQNWHYHNQEGNNRRTGALSRSMVLSMPENTDPQELLTAVRAFAEEEFSDRKYVMALHTDTEHPHVHLTIATRNQDLQRINITKDMLQDWREKFAQKLHDLDISANATSRRSRGLYHNRSQEHSDRDEQTQSNTKSYQLALNEAHSKHIYSRAIEQLEVSKSSSDRTLAQMLEPLAKKPSSRFKTPEDKAKNAMQAHKDYPEEQNNEDYYKMLKRILDKESFQDIMNMQRSRAKAKTATRKPKVKTKARKTVQKINNPKAIKQPPKLEKEPPERKLQKFAERTRERYKDRSR